MILSGCEGSLRLQATHMFMFQFRVCGLREHKLLDLQSCLRHDKTQAARVTDASATYTNTSFDPIVDTAYDRHQHKSRMMQMQAAKARMGSDDTPKGQLSPSPRILVLRESGDVEVNVELGDRENTPDGSFARTTTHRCISTSSASEGEQDQEESLPVSNIRVPSPTSESCILPKK